MLLDSIGLNKYYSYILIVAKNTNDYENRGGPANGGYTCLGVGGERSRGQGAAAGRRREAVKGSAAWNEVGGLGTRREGSSKTVPLQLAAMVAEGRGEGGVGTAAGGHCHWRGVGGRSRGGDARGPLRRSQEGNGGGPDEVRPRTARNRVDLFRISFSIVILLWPCLVSKKFGKTIL